MKVKDIFSGEKEMDFTGHLEELRWHIVRALGAVLVFTILAFIMAPWIFENIIFAPARANFVTFRMLCQVGGLINSDSLCVEEIAFKLQSRYMTGQFTMHIVASLIIGLIIAFPYVVWEFWRFIKPGLYKHERQNSRGAVAVVSFLFFMGVGFGFYVLSPIMISFLANYQISDMIVNEFDITSYVSTIVGVVFGTGLLFQLPVVIFFLSSIGVVTPQLLRQYRKHAVVAILIIGAIITPSADPLSQALIAIPLYILYEVSIVISARVVMRKAKAATQRETIIRSDLALK